MCGLANFGLSFVFERNYFKYKDNLEKLSQLLYTGIFFVLVNFTIIAGLTFVFKESVAELITGSSDHSILILVNLVITFFLIQ